MTRHLTHTCVGTCSRQIDIELDNDIFTAIVGTGVLTAAQFGANATGTATTAAMRIIYNTATGDLFYDSNGNAAGGRVAFGGAASGSPAPTFVGVAAGAGRRKAMVAISPVCSFR